MYQEKLGALSSRGNRLGETQAWKSNSCSKKKKKANRSDCLEHSLCQGKVGWGQIMEGFEYQTDESELCSVGNGEPLKTLEPQNDAIKEYLRKINLLVVCRMV